VKSGKTKSRSEAVTMVVLVLDRALIVQKIRLRPLD
jgi:hypothetical protein